MKLTHQTAKHLRAVYFGGNWSATNFKDTLSDVTWEEANKRIGDLNTIAILVFHATYYISGILPVLTGGALTTRDKYSWILPEITSQDDWEKLVESAYVDAEKFAVTLESLPDEVMHTDFSDKKYGSYFDNLHGIIEHLHYHLGQIVLLKKIVKAKNKE